MIKIREDYKNLNVQDINKHYIIYALEEWFIIIQKEQLLLLMKRLLLQPLAALAFPTAVNAESYCLILSSGNGDSAALEKIEMASMKQCEEQGKIFTSEVKKFQGNRK